MTEVKFSSENTGNCFLLSCNFISSYPDKLISVHEVLRDSHSNML